MDGERADDGDAAEGESADDDESRAERAAGPTVKAVETSHDVVAALQALGSATITEVADEAGISKGGAYKHLHTLRRRGFASKRGDQWSLGFRYLDIGGRLRFEYPDSSTIKEKVRALADETGEAALFTVEGNDRAVTLFRETGSRGVFTRTRVGTHLYLHQTAGGKAILSQLPAERVDEVVETVGLPAATENTITDRDALASELAAVRDRGYACNREESTEGLVAVAAPLVPDEEVVGACAVAGPRYRIGDRLESEMAETLLGVVNELELNIAHSQ